MVADIERMKLIEKTEKIIKGIERTSTLMARTREEIEAAYETGGLKISVKYAAHDCAMDLLGAKGCAEEMLKLLEVIRLMGKENVNKQ